MHGKITRYIIIIFSLLVSLNASSNCNSNNNNNNIKDNRIITTFNKSIPNVFHNHNNSSMKICLTFDDGPHPVYTPIILDILNEYDIKATFFMVGENVALYPEIAERVINEGHEVGNHTYTHPHIISMNYGTLLEELLDCEDCIYEISEYKTRLFRPPEGIVDNDILNVADAFDYKIILWNIDTRDWAKTSIEKIVENVVNNTDSGDIILMHDYISYNSPTPEALRVFIPMLKDKGYNFTVISDLLS